MAVFPRLLVLCVLAARGSWGWARTPTRAFFSPATRPPPLRAPPRLTRAPSLLFSAADASDDACPLPIISDEEVAMGAVDQALLALYRISLAAFPIVFPVIAFVNYELTVKVFHEVLELLSFQSKTWYSVDGGQAEAVLIQPLINGIVQPSVSVILACLIASTLTSLRNRQVSIRSSLNKEASALRQLDATIGAAFASPEDIRLRRAYTGLVRGYCTRLIAESREGSNLISNTCSSECELDGLLESIYAAPTSPGSARAERELRMHQTCLDSLPGILGTMQQQRAQRLAELQTGFPLVHWAILALLASAILFDFLIESDQAALLFLDSMRLRVLFSMMIGVISAAAALCIDLNDPFRGNFRISPSADQLYVIRTALLRQEEALERRDSSMRESSDSARAQSRVREAAAPAEARSI